MSRPLRDLDPAAGPDAPLALYEQMLLIRLVEERLIAEYDSRRLRMALHLSIGQEGVAVGVLGATRTTDVVVGTHRSHAVYLAKGGALQPMIDEFYSLPTGCSRGAGGSMHLSAPEVGLLGSSAVLAGGVAMAVGGGLAARQRGTGDVGIAFTGDGATEEGGFWESLNLAALLRLPVLFVVENNGYSTLTPQAHRQAVLDLPAKALAFGVAATRVDGTDVIATREATRRALEAVREGVPQLLEVLTFRYTAHVGVVPDWGWGRPEHEESRWPTDDPLARLLSGADLAPAAVAAVHERVEAQVSAAFSAAIADFERINAVAQLAAPPAPNPSRV